MIRDMSWLKQQMKSLFPVNDKYLVINDEFWNVIIYSQASWPR